MRSAVSDVKNKRASQKQGKKITGMQYMPAQPNKLLITSNDSRIRLYDGEAAGWHVHPADHVTTVLYLQLQHPAVVHRQPIASLLLFITGVAVVVATVCLQSYGPCQNLPAGFGLQCKFKGHVNRNTQIRASFSAGGEYIVCGSDDGWVYMWNGDDAQYPAGHPRHRSKQASGPPVAKCCKACMVMQGEAAAAGSLLSCHLHQRYCSLGQDCWTSACVHACASSAAAA